LGEKPWGKSQKKLEKTNKKQYLETLWESPNDKIKKKLEKTKKQKNKTFQRMFGLRLMFGFFGFAQVCLVFLVLTLKKQKNSR